MIERQRRKTGGPKRSKLALRISILVIIIGFLVLLFMPGRGFFHYRNLKKQVRTLEYTNEELQKENVLLEKEIERLRTDEKYIEKIAREKHGLLKKNEEVFIFKGSGKK